MQFYAHCLALTVSAEAVCSLDPALDFRSRVREILEGSSSVGMHARPRNYCAALFASATSSMMSLSHALGPYEFLPHFNCRFGWLHHYYT